MPEPKRTPLYERHLALGAKVIDFGGWAMPVQYASGILDEHKTVREAVGLFDVSHMGEVFVEGPRAAEAVQRVVTNDVARLVDGACMYTCTCREDGGIVDDLIVYRLRADLFLLIVNASTAEKDFAHFTRHAGALAEWSNRSDEWALISVQGPKAIALVREAGAGELPERPFTFTHVVRGAPPQLERMVSRTGYTGEDGVEILVPAREATKVWDLLLAQGERYSIKPIGLGARDTLRLEARLCLYGNDIDEEHDPIGAGLGWVVPKKEKPRGFVGEEAIEKIRAAGPREKLVGFKVQGRGIARHGYPIHACTPDGQPGERVGVVTSGTVAPTAGGAIGMGWVPAALAEPGTRLVADCRGKPATIELVKGPFYRRPQA
jgi:aminomethyltransferase